MSRHIVLAVLLLAGLLAGCSSPTTPTVETVETAAAEKRAATGAVGPRRQAALSPWCDRRVTCGCRELGEDLEIVYRPCVPPDPHPEPTPTPDPCPQPDPQHPVSCPTYDCRTSGCPDGSECLPTPTAPLPYGCVAEAPDLP